MNRNPFAVALASFLIIVLVAPTSFLIAPQRAQAQAAVVEVGGNLFTNLITTVKSTITAITGPINTAANVAGKINTYVLQPLAFILSGNLMKALTASVIGFVIGKANGTGVPQFVVDVRRSLQTVGDSQALAYLRQVSMTNSPFAGSISSALRTDYLTKTSLAGFWAANMNTLTRSSPDVPAYLNGNWSQGGVVAWFALTTQTQNNPYELYQHTQAQLAAVVGSGAGGATDVRLADINRSGGFTSWCGTSDAAEEKQNNASTAYQQCQAVCVSGSTATDDSGATTNVNCGNQCQAVFEAAGGNQAALSGRTAEGGIGINPGDPCSNKDGTPGTIKTPGSVIKSTLDKVLGGQQDKIVRMGNVGGQISDILGKIGTIVNTVQFASSLLGGDSGGLLAVNSTSASNPASRLAQFTPTQDTSGNFTSGYGGATQTGVYQAAAADGSSGGNMLASVARYEEAWDIISASANAASTKLDSLASFCTEAADKAALAATVSEFGVQITPTTDLSTIHSDFIDAARAQAVAAKSAITNVVAPVLAQAGVASTVSTKARAMVDKVQSELKAPTVSGNSTYAADLQALQSAPPSPTDVANAEGNARLLGATANPEGSLNVSSPPLAGQMNLLSTNAEALKVSVCTPGGGNQVIN